VGAESTSIGVVAVSVVIEGVITIAMNEWQTKKMNWFATVSSG